MKIGFSSLVCPGWDLETIVTNAAAWGFDGIEFRGLRGELHLPLVPALAKKPEATRALFAQKQIECVCLTSSATLCSRHPKVVATQKASLIEVMELASALNCPYVRLFLGEVEGSDTQGAALARVAGVLISLAPVASRLKVTLLVENGGDFAGSADLWFLVDAVSHPSVRCCWNQCHAMALRERPTISLPRLGNKIGLVHLCDARFDGDGVLLDYVPLGDGDVEIAKQVELLKGLLFDRYLMFEWPKLWVQSLPSAETILPEVAKFLRERIDAKQAILSAYKGDKHPAKLAAR